MMNTQTKPELFSIEVIRLETLTRKVAEELVALSDPSDTVSVIKSNWIHITYVGRGSESYELSLSGEFSDRTRIAYQNDVVLRLNKIKSYILEEAAWEKKMELQVLEQNVIVQAFATQGGSLLLVDRIAEEVRKHVPDVTTKKGRDAIGSLAAKVSKSKTLAEKYAKDLVAEEKARIKLVDDDRIQFVKRMDALRDEILAPRDAWEQAEKARVEKHKSDIEKIKDFAHPSVLHDMPANRIVEQIRMLDVLEICSLFEEFEQEAKIAKLETLEALRAALASREKYEAEQAELDRLRQAEQARLQREHEERIAREAAEKATREAEEKARFEAERVQREKLEAEQREARLKAEKEAALLREEQLKQQAIEREKQAEIDRQNAIEAERKRIEQEAQAKAEADRKALAEREANVEHMRTINNEALNAISLIGGVDADTAKLIVIAIAKNQIPHVSIKY